MPCGKLGAVAAAQGVLMLAHGASGSDGFWRLWGFGPLGTAGGRLCWLQGSSTLELLLLVLQFAIS